MRKLKSRGKSTRKSIHESLLVVEFPSSRICKKAIFRHSFAKKVVEKSHGSAETQFVAIFL